MYSLKIPQFRGPSPRVARSAESAGLAQGWLSASALPLGMAILLSVAAERAASAQSSAPGGAGRDNLGPVVVDSPTPRRISRIEASRQGAAKRTRPGPVRSARKPPPQPAVTDQAAQTPLNTNVVAASASRLGLTVWETPASVQVVSQQTMREQGYRTTTETAIGAVGVLSGDAGGSFGAFSMRGFTGSAVNVLYNGIWIGPQDITSRIMDTASLEQVEFLKGPSSLMSGLDAIGGSVNYVTRAPTSGPIKSELDTSIDTLGTVR